jgi:hypothetical protein
MSYWDEIERMRRAEEAWRRIERAGGIEHFTRQQDAIRQHVERGLFPDSRQRAIDAITNLSGDRYSALRQAEELALRGDVAGRYFDRLNVIEQAARTAQSRDEYFRLVQGGLTKTERLLDDLTNLHRRLQTEDERWGHIMRRESVTDWYAAAATRAAAAYDASSGAIAGRLHELNLLERRPLLAERLLAPTLDYSDFSTRTLERMTGAGSEEYARTLDASLVLADRQLSNMTVALGGVITVPEDEEEIAEPVSPPAPSVFYVQQEELLRVETIPTDADYSVIVQLSPTASVVDQAINCILLVTHVNYTVEMRTGKSIFKPTTKNMESCALLPRITACDRDSFGAFIDCLYFIVYEGSGYAKRYFEDGLLTKEECDPVWTIKHLRGKFLRHDIDHGDHKGIEVSRGNLQWALERMGFKTLPRTPEDYSRLQKAVLDDVQGFLTLVADRAGQ